MWRPALLLLLPIGLGLLGGCAPTERKAVVTSSPAKVRIALFNVEELSLDKLERVDDTSAGTDPQLLAAAAIVQRVRPEILVLNEIDFVAEDPTRAVSMFVEDYLARGEAPIAYPYLYSAPTNTGLLSGRDLDGDGVVATDEDRGTRRHGGDSWGYGTYPGQYGMALLSQHPIALGDIRSFQTFRWRDLPGHHLPMDYYAEAEQAVLRLSSKSHWDVPVHIGNSTLHLWMSHPTPPAFDGDEDRNGRRNFDEIKFWVAYLNGDPALYDDAGGHGGFAPAAEDAAFVIAGDLNARPDDEARSYDGRTAISQLLDHPEIQDTGALCTSQGGAAHAAAGSSTPVYPERSTAEFLGGARVDYLLPRRGVEVTDGGVFWPTEEEDPEGHRWAEAASDHRLVWLDLVLPSS